MANVTSTTTTALLAVALLAACSGGAASGTGGSGGESGRQIAGATVVTAPLNADERCFVEDDSEELGTALIPGAVGCVGPGQPDNPLAAVGSTFTAQTLTVTYRGGGFLRAPSDNADNPVRMQALAVFDVTFPDADAVWFTSQGLREVSIMGRAVSADGRETGLGACGVFPAASSRVIGAGQGYPVQVEGGETFTVAYCGSMGGQDGTLAGDPYVSFQASIGEGQTYANVALRDQDSDDRAFADVVATMELLAELSGEDPDEFGLSEIRSRFSALTDGTAIVTVEQDATSTPDAGDASGRAPVDSEFDEDGNLPSLLDPGERVAPSGPFDDEEDAGGDQGGAAADDDWRRSEITGLTRGRAIREEDPEEAAMWFYDDDRGLGGGYERSCARTRYRCVERVDEPFEDHFVFAVRYDPLESGDPEDRIDSYVLLERDGGVFYPLARWDTGAGAQPVWVPAD